MSWAQVNSQQNYQTYDNTKNVQNYTQNTNGWNTSVQNASFQGQNNQNIAQNNTDNHNSNNFSSIDGQNQSMTQNGSYLQQNSNYKKSLSYGVEPPPALGGSVGALAANGTVSQPPQPPQPTKSIKELQEAALQSALADAPNLVETPGADVDPNHPNYYKVKYHKRYFNNINNNHFNSKPTRGFNKHHHYKNNYNKNYNNNYHHKNHHSNEQNSGSSHYNTNQAQYTTPTQVTHHQNDSLHIHTPSSLPATTPNNLQSQSNTVSPSTYTNNTSYSQISQNQALALAAGSSSLTSHSSTVLTPAATTALNTSIQTHIQSHNLPQPASTAASALVATSAATLAQNRLSNIYQRTSNNTSNQMEDDWSDNEEQPNKKTNDFLDDGLESGPRHRQGSQRSLTDRWSVSKGSTSTNNLVTQHFKTAPGVQIELSTHIIYEKWLDFNLYPLTNYNFGTKDAVDDDLHDDPNTTSLASTDLKKLQDDFKNGGMRKTVEAVLIVHEHNLPHLLLLQKGKSTIFRLPGGKLGSLEDSHEGLRRHLKKILGKSNVKTSNREDPSQRGIEKDDWVIKDMLGQWYRPNFDHKLFAYQPAHVTKPKENIKLYLVQLPPKALFAVPRNYKLVAAPLHEVYNNSEIYGNAISMVPHMISRFNLHYKKDVWVFYLEELEPH